MRELELEEEFRRWHLAWKAQVCEEVRQFSDGLVLRSPSHPSYWEYNCVRLDRPMGATEMIALADRELADCAHRLVEWTIPMPDQVARELRELGWMATPLIFMLHTGDVPAESRGDLVEVDYDAVQELREIWHREDFGEYVESEAFHAEARQVAQLARARVVAAGDEGQPSGFAQVETHGGGSEVSQVFVRPERRGNGLGTDLTARAIRLGREAAEKVWICAERDGRPRQLYERLGFRPVVETAAALKTPPA
jgi:GNAT superfamily N-acetyltransferase